MSNAHSIPELVRATGELVLASGSPRRREILSALELKFRIQVSDVDEESLHLSTPRATAQAVALAKAQAVMDQCSAGTLVLAADTVVALDGELLLKPPTVDAAVAMLQKLSGRTHQVITGVAVGVTGGAVDLRAESAAVSFFDLEVRQIRDYAESGDPLDKAGGYGIQSGAGHFISRLEGDYYTVMGLPVDLVLDMLGDYPGVAQAHLLARKLDRPVFPLTRLAAVQP